MKHLSKIFLSIIITFLLITKSVLAVPGDIALVSVDSSGTQGNAGSFTASISADGRYVTYQSNASNLVSGDTNASQDVFVYDRNTGTTTRASVDSSGFQGYGSSYVPSISADGQYVAFMSDVGTLVGGDTNGETDIFVHDRNIGTTTRVSVDSSGAEGNATSFTPSLSADGRFIAFMSYASNLVVGDTNGTSDVFVHDRDTGITTCVSVDSSGVLGNGSSSTPSITPDGRYIVFQSTAMNLVAGDTNGSSDIFVHDRKSGTTTRVSVDSSGIEGNDVSTYATISNDGRYVAFQSYASNLVTGDTNGEHDIFVHDRDTGETTLVSVNSSGEQGSSSSYDAVISGDGRYVAFYSSASNLAAADTNGVYDVFIHDRNTGFTTCLSMDGNGIGGNDESFRASISNNGQYVTFQSAASNLVAGDSNGNTDIFVAEPDFSAPQVVIGSNSVPDTDGATLDKNQGTLAVQFNQHVLADGSHHAADSMVNYMLVRAGANGVFDTTLTSSAICDAAHTPEGDDEGVGISGITYDTAASTATLSIDAAFLPFAGGQYRLYVCGEHSIWNLRSIPLNNGTNMAINFRVENDPVPTVVPSIVPPSEQTGVLLPATGFAAHQINVLPRQTIAYNEMNEFLLEIPDLGVNMPIVGVPMTDGAWDVTWLGDKAGWLEGSAYPTWAGNAVLTGHVWNVDNTPGVFSDLHTLKWGDEVVVHLAGQAYVYEVRSVRTVSENNVKAMLSHEEAPWLTLVTCKGYDEESGAYRSRVLVRAVLKEIK